MNLNTLTDPNVIRWGIYKQNQYIFKLDQVRDSLRPDYYNEVLKTALILKGRLKTRLRQLT